MSKIIAIMSGKGGVGKSSVSAMIAKILSEYKKTIVLDYDLCGPSLTAALNLSGGLVKTKKGFEPIKVSSNLDALSLGVALNPGDAVIWRGPRKKSFLELFFDSSEGYEFIVVDTPPGVSEEHDFAASKISSVIIVTTPQNVALNDTQRCIEFCISNKLNIIGLIENMSSLSCECCGEVYHPFGMNGGESLSLEYSLKFLGKLEIEPNWSKSLDDGSFNSSYKELKAYKSLKTVLSSLEYIN